MIANILSQLGVNQTLWTQLVVFLVLFVLLKFIYFNPFLRLIELRESQTGGVEDEAGKIEADAAKKEEEYEARLSEAKLQAREAADSIVNKAKTEASSEVASARAANKSKIEQAREELETESRAAMKDLEGQVDKISGLFIDKIMKTKVDL